MNIHIAEHGKATQFDSERGREAQKKSAVARKRNNQRRKEQEAILQFYYALGHDSPAEFDHKVYDFISVFDKLHLDIVQVFDSYMDNH